MSPAVVVAMLARSTYKVQLLEPSHLSKLKLRFSYAVTEPTSAVLQLRSCLAASLLHDQWLEQS